MRSGRANKQERTSATKSAYELKAVNLDSAEVCVLKL